MKDLIKLTIIQKRNNLNEVFSSGDIGPGGAYHKYIIGRLPKIKISNGEAAFQKQENLAEIEFQKGPRNLEDSIAGVTEQDLLEIVRHRLSCFQSGEFSSRENAIALTKIEEALLWLNKRIEDRAERNVLGKYEK